MEVGDQRHAQAALPPPPGKTRKLGRSGRVRKISPLSGLDPRTVQPVASHYTDWAIPAHKETQMWNFMKIRPVETQLFPDRRTWRS